MSTQRYISTGFWDDEWVQTLDPSEKFLYIYLLTNPLTNVAGVYKITRRRICFDTGLSNDTVIRIMAKFVEAKKVAVCDEYIILKSWPTYQKWETKNCIKNGINAVLFELPKNVIKTCRDIGYKYDLTPFLKGVQAAQIYMRVVIDTAHKMMYYNDVA